MSMYGMLFGQSPASEYILATLGLTKGDCGRFRDCFVSEGKIALYTRLGGGNRECFCDTDAEIESGHTGCFQQYILRFQKHPHYLYDTDDDFDSTYATYYFSFPPEWATQLAALESGKFDPDARWMQMLDALKAGLEKE